MTKEPQSGGIAKLKAAYGPPSRAGFGSAVFHEDLSAADDLEQAALDIYRFFVGDLWERYGADAWRGAWRELYVRPAGAAHAIAAELGSLQDLTARLSAPMILDNDAVALAAVFDDPAVTELRVYTIGDGAALSGLLIAGRRPDSGETTFLVFLMD